MKEIILTVAVCLIAFAGAAQDSERVVASRGEVGVTAGELEAAIDTLPDDMKVYIEGEGRKSFVEDLLRMKLLAAAAEKNGVVNDPAVKAQLALNRANTLANAQVEKMRDAIEVDADRVAKTYAERKNQFERAKARHILIAFEGSPAAGDDPPTDAEAKEKAEALLARIKDGEDFATIARAESDDKGSGARGGDLGEFARGQMVPAFEEAVFSTEPGSVAPVVKTQFGYHIIEVQDRRTLPLESVRDQIEKEIRQEELQLRIESFGDGSEVKFDDEYFAPTSPSSVPE